MKYFLTLAVVATSLFAYSQAKGPPDGEINLIVTDRDGTPLPGVTVYAVPEFVAFEGITPCRSRQTGMGSLIFTEV